MDQQIYKILYVQKRAMSRKIVYTGCVHVLETMYSLFVWNYHLERTLAVFALRLKTR